MNASAISSLVGSSHYEAFSDDSLKDEDNAAWVMLLQPQIRDEWIERIGWIRLIDRLAENELIRLGSCEFRQFQVHWKHLLKTGQVYPDYGYQEILLKMRARWFEGSPCAVKSLSIQAWDRYLDAIARYHTSHLVIDTLAQYERMLTELAGAFFQILPFLPEKYWQAAACWGTIDQFYNNLRDMQEDAAQGVCYFPTELLDRFGVSRIEILEQRAVDNPGYSQLMQFWLNEYLPQLRRQATPLLEAEDLPVCWCILRAWSLHRYARIEQVFRACNFNYTQFAECYWFEVKQDLPGLCAQVQQAQQDCVASRGQANQSLLSRERREILPAVWSLSRSALSVIKNIYAGCLGQGQKWLLSPETSAEMVKLPLRREVLLQDSR